MLTILFVDMHTIAEIFSFFTKIYFCISCRRKAFRFSAPCRDKKKLYPLVYIASVCARLCDMHKCSKCTEGAAIEFWSHFWGWSTRDECILSYRTKSPCLWKCCLHICIASAHECICRDECTWTSRRYVQQKIHMLAHTAIKQTYLSFCSMSMYADADDAC